LPHRAVRLPAHDQRLAALGIDSLTMLELKNSLTSDFGVALPAEELFDAGSLGEIAQRIQSLKT
jgi:acyl carrier protein